MRPKVPVIVTLDVGETRVLRWRGRITGSRALPKALAKVAPDDAEPSWAGLTKRRTQ